MIELAKIQIRRGQETVTGVPQLDSGEFGWAVDTQALYIGNGSLEEGAPEVGNTEILTEHTLINLFSLPNYSYSGHSYSAPVTTGPDNNSLTVRGIQSKLDDFVTLYDFAGVGNGVTNNGMSLQQAINELYLNAVDKTDPLSRIALRIPAGVYNIEKTIYVPPFTTLIGEGKGKTILNLVDYVPLIQYCDQTSTPTSNNFVLLTSTGTNILSGSAPHNINFIGITFAYDVSLGTNNTYPLILSDCVTESYMYDCEFQGDYQVGISAISNINYCGISIRGQGIITSKNLILQNCTFQNLYYGIKSDYDIEDILVTECTFKNLNRGIVFTENFVPGNNTGPVRSRIQNNIFNDIEREGIFVGQNASNVSTFHASSFNTFKEVGNNLQGDLNPVTPLISYKSRGNSSVNDIFLRLSNINSTSTSVSFFHQSVDGVLFVDDIRTRFRTIITGTSTLIKLPYSPPDQAVLLQYAMHQNSLQIARKGELLINASSFPSGVSTATITDSYTYMGPTNGGLDFSVDLNTSTNILSVLYSSSGSGGTITYKYNQLQS